MGGFVFPTHQKLSKLVKPSKGALNLPTAQMIFRALAPSFPASFTDSGGNFISPQAVSKPAGVISPVRHQSGTFRDRIRKRGASIQVMATACINGKFNGQSRFVCDEACFGALHVARSGNLSAPFLPVSPCCPNKTLAPKASFFAIVSKPFEIYFAWPTN